MIYLTLLLLHTKAVDAWRIENDRMNGIGLGCTWTLTQFWTRFGLGSNQFPPFFFGLVSPGILAYPFQGNIGHFPHWSILQCTKLHFLPHSAVPFPARYIELVSWQYYTTLPHLTNTVL